MSAYPNMEIVANGCASGKVVEWVELRPEARAILNEVKRLQTELADATEENLVGLGDSPVCKPDERHGFKIFGMRLPPKKWEWVNTCVGHFRNQIEDELAAGQSGSRKLALQQTLLLQSACRYETAAQANNLFMVWCENPRKKADWMQKCAAAAGQSTQKRDACLRQLGILPALTTKQGRGLDDVSRALAAGGQLVAGPIEEEEE